MDRVRKKFYIAPHLQLLYNSFSVLGLMSLKFNYSTTRFESSRFRRILSTVIYNLVRFLYGFAVLTYLTNLLSAYLHTRTVQYGFSSVGAQDHFLSDYCTVREYISALLYVCNYFRFQRVLLPTLNELADIYHAIHRQSNARLHVDGALTKILFMKLCITCCRLRMRFLGSFMITVVCGEFLWVFGAAIPELTFASHVYCQLFLTSVYLQINELLAAAASSSDRRKLRLRIKELVALSHRLHCMKHKLNEIYKPVYLDTIFGAIFDIGRVYSFLKTLFYFKYTKSGRHIFSWLFRLGFPGCVSYTFDAYLIGMLSKDLLEAEEVFRTLLMTISNRRKLGRRAVELALFQGNVYGLGSVLYGNFRMDQEFAFDYAINIVLNFALTCLQFYAGEEVYATTSTLGGAQGGP